MIDAYFNFFWIHEDMKSSDFFQDCNDLGHQGHAPQK